jgi:hypothetical protein
VYLKTSDIAQDAKYCPKEICQVIYDVNKNNNVVIKDNSNNIMCDFSKFNPPNPTPNPNPTPLPPIPDVIEPPKVDNGLIGNKNVLMAGAIMAALLVIFLIFTISKSK